MLLWLHGNDEKLGKKLTEDEERRFRQIPTNSGSLGLRRWQELEQWWLLTVGSKNERWRLGSSLYRVGIPQFGWKSREIRVRFSESPVSFWLGYDGRRKTRLTCGSRPSTKQRREGMRGCSSWTGPHGRRGEKKVGLGSASPTAREGRSRLARAGLQAAWQQVRR
jgi:hypothetical protein